MKSIFAPSGSGWIVGHPEVMRRGPPTKAAGVPHDINEKFADEIRSHTCIRIGPVVNKGMIHGMCKLCREEMPLRQSHFMRAELSNSLPTASFLAKLEQKQYQGLKTLLLAAYAMGRPEWISKIEQAKSPGTFLPILFLQLIAIFGARRVRNFILLIQSRIW